MESPDAARTYSGLFAPSPSAFAKCSNIIQIQGSRGFSETNGEVSLWTTLLPRSLETSFAALHCTNTGYPDCTSCILIARTFTAGEYVRVRNTRDVSRRLVLSDHWTRFKERQIRIPVDPTQPPANIFNGFRLRTLQPPGHNNCHTIILSHSQTSNEGHICQHGYNPGVVGIVHMKPKEGRDHSGWCKIQWITFGFDEDFNPVIRLANNMNSQWLSNAFEHAVASGNDSGGHQQLMETCKKAINNKNGTMERRLNSNLMWISKTPNIRSDGALLITVDWQYGIRGRVIADLNLKLSVQLQPFCNPASSLTADAEDSGLPLSPTGVWTVEIAGADGESAEEKESRSKAENFTIKAISVFLWLVFFCIVIGVVVKHVQANHVYESSEG